MGSAAILSPVTSRFIETSRKLYGTHMTEKQINLCARLKGLGFTKGNQVKLYGDVFELTGEPVLITDTVVHLNATEIKSGQLRRVRLPLPIVNMATAQQNAA